MGSEMCIRDSCSGGWCCENATLYTKTKRSVAKKERVEAGDERHSSNTLTLVDASRPYREYTVSTVLIQKTRDLTAGPMLTNDLLYMVRAVRLELTRLLSLRILSPLRLPIPPCSPCKRTPLNHQKRPTNSFATGPLPVLFYPLLTDRHLR